MSYFVRFVLCYTIKKKVNKVNKEDIIIEMLENHSARFEGIEQKLENHSVQLTEYSQILKALLTGQEHLKAGLDGFKISTGKAFEKLNEKVDTLSINHEIL